jgi:hypothetical protein
VPLLLAEIRWRSETMFEAIIRALIYICLMVLAFFLIMWVLSAIGLVLPAMVEKILMVILVLIAILVLFRLFSPWVGSFSLWGPGPGPRPPGT